MSKIHSTETPDLKKLLNEKVQRRADGTVERWRDIPGWEGFYRVSDKGRVKSLARKVVHSWNGGMIFRKARIMRLAVVRKHLVLTLQAGGREEMKYVHRLVLEAFVGPCPEGMECRHFPDRDPANNRLENLQWGTRLQNRRDRKVQGECLARGERHGNAKLSESAVRKIRKLYRKNLFGYKRLAAMFGVDQVSIYNVIARKTWNHVL